MRTKLRPGEAVVQSGVANLQRKAETVGGKLWLTNQRLVFEAHRLNIQTGVTQIELASLPTLRFCWTKFLGLIPLLPNSLAVLTREGKEYRFALYRRKTWAAAIEAQKRSLNERQP